MSPLRPDLVGCWVFRVTATGEPEILLLKRAPGRIFPGIWQCVTGGLEPGERVVDGALRELVEETGYRSDDLEAFYSLDQVNLFHADHKDAIEVEAVFAARVRPERAPTVSEEHDDMRWVSPSEGRAMVVWPAYRVAIDQVEWLVRTPEHARWLMAGPWAEDGASPPERPAG
jgi:8-oxo-dGTP pyrophosphatase MutT (NUDIX family)